MADQWINRAHVRDTFHRYVTQFDTGDVRVTMKASHAGHVAALSAQIAQALSLSEEETGIAWLTGMLHDIGHFEQLARYGTFFDKGSVDHAALGADLLFRDGHIRDYVASDRHDLLIEHVIRAHNRFRLPKNQSDRERMFCRILRDADKIDILRIASFEPPDAVYETDAEKVLSSAVSKEVEEVFHTRHVIDHDIKHTPADFMAGDASLAFGLFYRESRKLLKETGYHKKIFAHPMTDAATCAAFLRMEAELDDYLG